MAKLTLSAEQRLTLETFFQKLKLFTIGTPGAYPDNLGFVLSEILGGEVSLASYASGSRPTSPVAGDLIFNTTTDEPEFWSGAAWIPIGPDGSGTVTSVATTADLTGGPITTTGTLGLANTTVTPGSYTNASVTVDAKGRITAAANGTASILSTIYATGTVAADQTMLVQAGDGGPVIFKANGAATGSLVKAQTSTAVELLDLNDNSTQLIKSAMADGASAVALKTDTTSGWVNATAKLLSICNNNVEKFNITPTGIGNFSSYITTPSGAAGGLFSTAGTKGILVDDSGFAVLLYNGGIASQGNLTSTCGDVAKIWKEVWSREYAGIQQDNTSNGAISVDTTLGETYVLTANGNITSITLSDGKSSQQFTLVLVQDGAGTSTWTNTIVNAKLAGGVFTKTVTASAVDTLTFRWNGADWLEIGRTLALS